jgi:hypothetical protein
MTRRSTILPFAACLLAILAGSGCGVLDEPLKQLVLGDSAPPDPKTLPTPRHYPKDAVIDEPLTIEVRREGGWIRLDNRTTRSYAQVELWLNHEYGHTIAHLPIGLSKRIPLGAFINNQSERYPIGSILRPKENRVLILVDLIQDKKIYKLTTRLVENWEKP